MDQGTGVDMAVGMEVGGMIWAGMGVSRADMGQDQALPEDTVVQVC